MLSPIKGGLFMLVSKTIIWMHKLSHTLLHSLDNLSVAGWEPLTGG